jgi:4-hydroxy-tetrahydrodipicolinate reductase
VWKLAGAVDHPDHPDIGKDIGLLAGCGAAGVVLSGQVDKKADVLIDFSLPSAAEETVAFVKRIK